MRLHRLGADLQVIGDLLAEKSGHHLGQHLALARGEAGDLLEQRLARLVRAACVPVGGQRLAHRVQQGARVGRLLEEIRGALLQRLHDHRDVAVAGEEEHRRQVRLAGPRAPCKLLEQLEAAHAGNAHVDHQAVVAARRGAFQEIGRALELRRRPAAGVEQQRQ